ncbi:MAG: CBS domain-containing protein [Candidatus Nitrosopolaris sp.]
MTGLKRRGLSFTTCTLLIYIIKSDTLQGEICITKASDIMTKNIVAARASTTAREIGTKLLIGNFNGIPVVDNNSPLTDC